MNAAARQRQHARLAGQMGKVAAPAGQSKRPGGGTPITSPRSTDLNELLEADADCRKFNDD